MKRDALIFINNDKLITHKTFEEHVIVMVYWHLTRCTQGAPFHN